MRGCLCLRLFVCLCLPVYVYESVCEWWRDVWVDRVIDGPTDRPPCPVSCILQPTPHPPTQRTLSLTLGVIKNIIPAVASTNAVIAAVSVQEALKVLTFMGQVMNNYMMYQASKRRRWSGVGVVGCC